MRLLLLLALLLPATALAQAPADGATQTGKLAGVMTDDRGESLPGGTVFLPQIQRGAATDIDGRYTIIGLPVGVYEVQFSYVGFEPQTIMDVAISADRTRTLDVTMPEGDLPLFITCFTSCYERPMFSNDAYSPRFLTGYDLENRPDRYTNGGGMALTSVYSR